MNKIAMAVLMVAGMVMGSALPAQAAPTVRFSYAQYDSPGSDTRSNYSLNHEFVRVHNYGSTGKLLNGWTIRDASGHTYRLPLFTLKSGRTVTVHSGRGTNTATDLYWGSSAYIWNNTGDKATLKNKYGTVIDTCKWYDGDGNTAC